MFRKISLAGLLLLCYTVQAMQKEPVNQACTVIERMLGFIQNVTKQGPIIINAIQKKGDTANIHRLHCGGAQLDRTDENGDTALHYAARHGYSQVMNYLLEHGALKKANKLGRTPLFDAVDNNQEKMVEHLLPGPFDADDQDQNGDTALHRAALQGNISIIKMLEKNGASINIRNLEAEYPLHKALVHNNPALIEELASKGNINAANYYRPESSPHLPLAQAILDNNTGQSIDALLKKGADPNKYFNSRATPLELVAARCNSLRDPYGVTKSLLEGGAKVSDITLSEKVKGKESLAVCKKVSRMLAKAYKQQHESKKKREINPRSYRYPGNYK